MQGVCSKCGRTYGGQMLCPACGIRLDDEGGSGGTSVVVPLSDDTPDGPSFPRRLAFGLIALLGLYHGLKHLAIAGALLQTGIPALSADGHLSLLVLATLAASIAAGTVNRRAEVTGLILAGAAAAGFLAPDLLQGGLPDEWLIGVPVMLGLTAVVGGLAGRLIVPPAPRLPTFGRLDSQVVVRVERKRPPIAWPQAIAGAALAVAGTAKAEAIRQAVGTALMSGGGSFGARPLIAWQISMLAALLGGVVAGLRTQSNLRQTVVAGFLAAAGVVTVLLTTAGGVSPVLDFWADQLGTKVGNGLPLAALAVTTALATGLGSWLGGHVAPPVGRK